MAGILLQGTLGWEPWPWAVGAALAGAALLFSRRGLAVGALALGAWVAAEADASPPPEPPALASIFAGTVARPVEALADGAREALLDLDAGVRVRVRDPGVASLLPGDRARVQGRARRPRGYLDEGAFDRATLLAARGIDWVLGALRPGVVPSDEPTRFSPWRAAALVRARAAAGLAAASSGDGAALLQALVLGRRGDISPALDDAFRRAGVAHVLSVSGLHLAVAAALFFAAARAAWLRWPRLSARVPADRAAALCAAPAVAAYTALTGAEIATVRSLLCAAVVLGARALGRSADALTSLATAALVLLAAAPASLYDPSFQLSFAAAGALVLVAPRLRGGFVARLVGASAAATLATAPLTALHFHVVQPAGVLTNLVVVPLAELLVLPAGLLAAALALLSPTVAAPITALAGLAAEGLARLTTALAAFSPSFAVPPPRPLELAALALAVWALLAGRAARLGVAAALVVATSFVWTMWVAPALRSDARVTFLDVGQGNAAVIEAPAGATWLVDAGGRLFGTPATPGDPSDPGQAVVRFLQSRRARRLELVVVSHPHPDHFGGLAAVAAAFTIDEVWISGDDPGDPRWAVLLADLAARGVRVRRPAAGTEARAGAARLAVLSGAADPDRGVNDNSLVVALSIAGRRVLFPGDLEAAGEAALVRTVPAAALASDVVLVPHHGSRTSSSAPLVAATHPRLAVVSCGADNRFGFPALAVVRAWRAAGAAIARTDELGAITVTLGAGDELAWTSYARPWPRAPDRDILTTSANAAPPTEVP
jgi:competence protein ComEC